MEVGSERVDQENHDEEIKSIQNPAQNSRSDGILPSWRLGSGGRNLFRHSVSCHSYLEFRQLPVNGMDQRGPSLHILHATKAKGSGTIFTGGHQQ